MVTASEQISELEQRQAQAITRRDQLRNRANAIDISKGQGARDDRDRLFRESNAANEEAQAFGFIINRVRSTGRVVTNVQSFVLGRTRQLAERQQFEARRTRLSGREFEAEERQTTTSEVPEDAIGSLAGGGFLFRSDDPSKARRGFPVGSTAGGLLIEFRDSQSNVLTQEELPQAPSGRFGGVAVTPTSEDFFGKVAIFSEEKLDIPLRDVVSPLIGAERFGKSLFSDFKGTVVGLGSELLSSGGKLISGEGFPGVGRAAQDPAQFTANIAGELLFLKGSGKVIKAGTRTFDIARTRASPSFRKIVTLESGERFITGVPDIGDIGLIPESSGLTRTGPATLRGGFGFSKTEQAQFIGKTGPVTTSARDLFKTGQPELIIAEGEAGFGLFATPFDIKKRFPQTRTSRLGESPRDATIREIIEGDFALRTPKSQIVVFPDQTIGKQFKPFGFPSSELEVTLPPGTAIRKTGQPGVTLIGQQFKPITATGVEGSLQRSLAKGGELFTGKRVQIITADIFDSRAISKSLGSGGKPLKRGRPTLDFDLKSFETSLAPRTRPVLPTGRLLTAGLLTRGRIGIQGLSFFPSPTRRTGKSIFGDFGSFSPSFPPQDRKIPEPIFPRGGFSPKGFSPGGGSGGDSFLRPPKGFRGSPRPFFILPSLGASEKKKRRKPIRTFRRRPSLRAAALDITAFKPVKGEFTGLVERPVLVSRRRRRKKRN